VVLIGFQLRLLRLFSVWMQAIKSEKGFAKLFYGESLYSASIKLSPGRINSRAVSDPAAVADAHTKPGWFTFIKRE